MEFAVLDSDILFVSEDDWLCDDARDIYLTHFLDVMSTIDKNQNLHLAWGEFYEELLWESPQKMPWNTSRCWNNAIVPQLYRKIQNNGYYINVDGVRECDVAPEMECGRYDIYCVFKLVISALHGSCKSIFVFLGLSNLNQSEFSFNVGEEGLSPSPFLLHDPNDYFKTVDVADEYWPKTSGDELSLREGIMLMLSRDYGLDAPVNEFSFSKGFVKKLVRTLNDRPKILSMIAKRLSMTAKEAAQDGTLQDESVNDEKRFRVTPRPSSKRIHYEYVDGKINFLMFYDVGEHDDGL